MRIGVSGDQRRITDGGNIPKSLFVEVGEVDENLSSLQARISVLPRSVKPGPVSGDAEERNGTPYPNALGRLQNGPRERSPAACKTSRTSKFSSMASAP